MLAVLHSLGMFIVDLRRPVPLSTSKWFSPNRAFYDFLAEYW